MFRRSEQVDKWFGSISGKGPFSTRFDEWYVCMLAGLMNGKMATPPDAKDLIGDFTADYQPSRRIILGLLVVAEMKRHEISGSDRDDIQKLLDTLIDPDSQSKLTDEGFDRLNKYSYGGFCFLQESYPEKPSSPEDFLQYFCNKLEEWDIHASGLKIQ